MTMSARSWRLRLAHIAVGGFLFLLVALGTLANLVQQNCGSDFNYYGCDVRNPERIGGKVARLPPAIAARALSRLAIRYPLTFANATGGRRILLCSVPST